MRFQCPAVAIDEVPKEVKQFGFIVAILWLVLDVLADLAD
jgi:hypothetical protein